MTLQDMIEDMRDHVVEKYGVCSLCGKSALGTILMTFINKNDEEIRFCIEHSPWHPVSEAQRHWRDRMMKYSADTRIAMQESGDTEPDNPLPSWCKERGESL